ncbi:retrovirus-related pol polyprotein from transposon TNT 1-94 [Tanacetum coccineum]
MQQPMQNPNEITNPTTAMNMALVLMAKALKLNNLHQQTTKEFHQTYAIDKLHSRNVGNHNRLIVVLGIANQNGNGNVVVPRAEGNGNGNNDNQIRCYSCGREGHYARNNTVRLRRMDVAYLQTQLLIAQKEEAGIQLQAEEFDLMVVAAKNEEIKEVNANCIFMTNFQQASSSGTHGNKAPVYDSYGSDVNDNNVIPIDSSMEHSGGMVEQHPATVEETHDFYESL